MEQAKASSKELKKVIYKTTVMERIMQRSEIMEEVIIIVRVMEELKKQKEEEI